MVFKGCLIIVNNVIAYKALAMSISSVPTLFHVRDILTVKAVATSKSLPRITYAKKETIETRIGAVVQSA